MLDEMLLEGVYFRMERRRPALIAAAAKKETTYIYKGPGGNYQVYSKRQGKTMYLGSSATLEGSKILKKSGRKQQQRKEPVDER